MRSLSFLVYSPTIGFPHSQHFSLRICKNFVSMCFGAKSINDLIILEADWLTTVQLRVLALYRQTQHFKRVSCKHTLAYICPFSHLAFNLSNFGSNYTPGGIFHISVDPHPLNNSSHWLASGTRCISSGFPEILKFERRNKFIEKVQPLKPASSCLAGGKDCKCVHFPSLCRIRFSTAGTLKLETKFK